VRLRDIPDGAYWDSERIVYWDETYIDVVSRLALAGQKVRSAAEFQDMLAASRRFRGTRALWVHEDLIDEVQRRWQKPRAAAKTKWQVRGPAMVAAAVTLTFAAGLMAVAQVPRGPGPLPGPAVDGGHHAVLPARAARPDPHFAQIPALLGTTAFAITHRGPTPAGAGGRMAYAVTLGSFVSPAYAGRITHSVRGKGYIVMVVPRGAATQVRTQPYHTRGQAERIRRGLAAIGIVGQVTAWELP
jgi:cell division septation protein DedD